MNMTTPAKGMAAVLTVFVICSCPSRAAAGDHEVSLQAGWWSAEAGYTADFGLFGEIGWPWFAAYIHNANTGVDWAVPVAAKIGYLFDVSEEFKVRMGFRTVFVIKSAGGTTDAIDDSFGLLEVGLRYRAKSGLTFGIELPLLVTYLANPEFGEIIPYENSAFFPFSLAWGQLYIGYTWTL